MDAVMTAPPGNSIRTCAVVAPFFTSRIFPFNTLRALNRMVYDLLLPGMIPASHQEKVAASRSRRSWTKRAFELPLHRALQPLAKLAIPRQELLRFGREPHSAPRAVGTSLDELEAGRARELAEIPPGVAVRHLEFFRGPPQRPELLDEIEQPGAPLADLEVVAERDPDLDLGLHDDP